MPEKSEEQVQDKGNEETGGPASDQQDDIASFFTEMPSGGADASKDAGEGERTPPSQESQEQTTEEQPAPDDPPVDGGADASGTQQQQSAEEQAALARIAQALESRPQPQPQQEQKKEEKDEELPNYMFDIPTNLVRALRSEDESEVKQGLQALVSGMLRMAHSTIRQEFSQRLATHSEDVQKRVSEVQAQAQVRQAVTDDFYQAYPQLKHPAVQPILNRVWDTIIRAENPQTWNEALRKRIGDATIAEIKALSEASGIQVAPPPPNDPAPQRQVNSGARPGPSRVPQRDEITELFTDG